MKLHISSFRCKYALKLSIFKKNQKSARQQGWKIQSEQALHENQGKAF